MLKKLFFILALIISPIACAHAQGVVTVGVLAPLSGFAAADGNSALTSIKLAAKDINAHGGLLGKQIALKVYDDQADPKQAVGFARRLVEQDHVSFVIGASYSGATLAAAPILNDDHVPMIVAYAVAPDITKGHPYVFGVGLTGPVEGRVGAYLAQKLGARNIAMINLKNDFGQALEQGFTSEAAKRHLKIVFSEDYPLGNQNFTPMLVRLKGTHPQAIYASGYYSDAANLVRQAKALGIHAAIIGQDGYDSPKFIDLAGGAADGVYITTQLNRDSKRADVVQFLKDYKATAGEPADMVGASGYAAMEVMAEAVKKAGSLKGDAVRKALSDMKNVDTVAGRIYQWNANGNPVKTATVQVVKKGAFHLYKDVTDRKLLTP
ncbi:MAG: ABC transporter substrate-binding protein [Syntrophobacteraceae bacterium]